MSTPYLIVRKRRWRWIPFFYTTVKVPCEGIRLRYEGMMRYLLAKEDDKDNT